MAPDTTHEKARLIADLMIDKKASDVVIMDVGKLTDVSDYFILCSGDNDQHVKAIADNVKDKLATEYDMKPWRTEGWQGGTWIILDFVEVVAHIFYRETRHFYKLERLWAEAPIEHLEAS